MYDILVAPRAGRDLDKLPQHILARVDRAILKLRLNPYPFGVKHLRDSKVADFRVRIGDYRVLYDVDESAKVVLILRAGHRKEVYR